MKIITDIRYISDIFTSRFLAHQMDDELIYYKYHQDKPYSLLIMVNYERNELVLEFTGKILADLYPSLINKDTIRQCLTNINRLGLCRLDIDSIIKNGFVGKCDATKDIASNELDGIIASIRFNLKNHKRWAIKEYRGGSGIVLEKAVSTPIHKKRLLIYDKSRELEKAENKPFLGILNNPDTLKEHFKDKIRFELNINTMAQIRTLLNIPDNSIMNVLNSKANPILSVIDEALKYDTPIIKRQSLRDYERIAMLEKCDYDLGKVEAIVRNYTSSVTRAMKPYIELSRQSASTQTIDLRRLVA